jgi:hypothetical protein
MAKVMEFFIYQNFRGNFYPKNQKMFRNQSNRDEMERKGQKKRPIRPF